MESRIKRSGRTKQRINRHGGGDLSGSVESLGVRHREGTDRRHQMRAVEQCQPLFRAERNGSNADRAKRVRPRQANATRRNRLPLTNQHEREVCKRGEVATRTNRAARRYHWSDIAVEQRNQRFNELDPHTGMATRQRSSQQDHHAARDIARQRLANANSMAAHNIDLQL